MSKRTYSGMRTVRAPVLFSRTARAPYTLSRLGLKKAVFAMRRRKAPFRRSGFGGNYGAFHGELKYADTVYNNTINTTGSITVMAIPVLGTDYTNRIGRKVTLKSIFIRGFMYRDMTVASLFPAQCRMMIVLDKQPNGAVPAITDILNSATSTSQLNPNNRDRFVVIRDVVKTFGPNYGPTPTPTDVGTGSPQAATIELYKRVNIPVVFNSTNGGSVADINSNALLFVLIGSVASGNSDGQFIGTSRVRFQDE